MTWAAHGEELRCGRHGEVFSRLEQCPGCVTDPEPLPTEVDLDADLNVPISALVAELTAEQKRIEHDLKTLRGRKVKAPWVYAAIGKLVDAKTKIWRARMEAARISKDETQVARRERRLVPSKVNH